MPQLQGADAHLGPLLHSHHLAAVQNPSPPAVGFKGVYGGIGRLLCISKNGANALQMLTVLACNGRVRLPTVDALNAAGLLLCIEAHACCQDVRHACFTKFTA